MSSEHQSKASLGIILNNDPGAVKVIDKQDEHYYQLHPSKTHTPDELAALHRAIRYTQKVYPSNAEDRAEEVSDIVKVLPRI